VPFQADRSNQDGIYLAAFLSKVSSTILSFVGFSVTLLVGCGVTGLESEAVTSLVTGAFVGGEVFDVCVDLQHIKFCVIASAPSPVIPHEGEDP
jgi:hypothetical protein